MTTTMVKLFTTSQAAKRLRIPESRLADLLRRGKVPEPGMRVGSRRAWTEEEIDRAEAIVLRNA